MGPDWRERPYIGPWMEGGVIPWSPGGVRVYFLNPGGRQLHSVGHWREGGDIL